MLQLLLEGFWNLNYIGKKVKHKIFGFGEVTGQNASEIFIKFSGKDTSLVFDISNIKYKKFFDFIEETPAREKLSKEEIIIQLENFLVSYILDNKIINIPTNN